MALTLNGRRTGRAGSLDLRDQREMIYAEQERQADKRFDEFRDVRNALKFLDPKGWEAWYDEHVPDWLGWINSQPAIDVMYARVCELMKGREPFDFHGLSEADVDRLHDLVLTCLFEPLHVAVVPQAGAER